MFLNGSGFIIASVFSIACFRPFKNVWIRFEVDTCDSFIYLCHISIWLIRVNDPLKCQESYYRDFSRSDSFRMLRLFFYTYRSE